MPRRWQFHRCGDKTGRLEPQGSSRRAEAASWLHPFTPRAEPDEERPRPAAEDPGCRPRLLPSGCGPSWGARGRGGTAPPRSPHAAPAAPLAGRSPYRPPWRGGAASHRQREGTKRQREGVRARLATGGGGLGGEGAGSPPRSGRCYGRTA